MAPGAIDVLRAYEWPGNVRELENLVERSMILHGGESLRFDDLAAAPAGSATAVSPATDGDTLGFVQEDRAAEPVEEAPGILRREVALLGILQGDIAVLREGRPSQRRPAGLARAG